MDLRERKMREGGRIGGRGNCGRYLLYERRLYFQQKQKIQNYNSSSKDLNENLILKPGNGF